MDSKEFDKFANEYRQLHEEVIGPSGEDADFFAEYKIVDVAQLMRTKDYPENIKILDFGCGVGSAVPFIRKHLPEARLTCLDVSRKSLDIAADRYGGAADFVQFDGQHLPAASDSYDVVFTACVFHHIPQEVHRLLTLEIHRVLRPGGVFIAFEHNPYNPLTVRTVNRCVFDEDAVLIRGRAFQRLLGSAGFIPTSLHYRLFFPGQLGFLRFLEKYLTKIPLGAQYYVVGEKPP